MLKCTCEKQFPNEKFFNDGNQELRTTYTDKMNENARYNLQSHSFESKPMDLGWTFPFPSFHQKKICFFLLPIKISNNSRRKVQSETCLGVARKKEIHSPNSAVIRCNIHRRTSIMDSFVSLPFSIRKLKCVFWLFNAQKISIDFRAVWQIANSCEFINFFRLFIRLLSSLIFRKCGAALLPLLRFYYQCYQLKRWQFWTCIPITCVMPFWIKHYSNAFKWNYIFHQNETISLNFTFNSH